MTRPAALLLAAAAVPAGIAAEVAASAGFDVLDLLVGWTMAGCGAALALRGRHRAGLLVAAAAAAWFAGTVLGDLALLHRGILAVAVVGAPDARLTSRRAQVAALVSLVAVAPQLSDLRAAVVTAVAVLAARPRSGVALAYAAAIAGVPLVRAIRPGSPLGDIAVYDLAIAAVTLLLTWSAVRPRVPLVDLVVQLGETGVLESVRHALADAIGDPDLRLGRWSETAAAYVDGQGRELGQTPPEMIATRLDRDGAPFAVIVHSRTALADGRLGDAVAAAARMGAENARLQHELEVLAADIDRSRRRLVGAANREREALGRRLDDGPVRRLAALAPTVADIPAAGDLLADVQRDLATLGRGLLPAAVERGDLAAAIAELAAAPPLPVAVDAAPGAVGRDAAAAAYFVAAEGIANAVKHAGAGGVTILIRHDGERLHVEVGDDGRGGADPRGSGLRGLADRVEALGGTITIESGPDTGTRLSAVVPAAQ